MHKRQAVPLIGGITIGPILDLLSRVGAPTDEYLLRTNVPLSRLRVPTGFVSARSILRFVALSASYADLGDLGWRVSTQSQISKLGCWGGPVSRCRTLREAIRTFCELYTQEISFVKLGLSFEDDHAWLWRRRDLPSKNPAGELQGEQYMLGAMIQVVRQVAGSRWAPPSIRLDSRSPEWLRQNPDLRDSRLILGQPSMAIAIPYDLLDRRLAVWPPPQKFQSNESRTLDIPNGFLDSLRTSLVQVCSQTALPIELGAEIAGASPRTLRRWLQEEGTSWRELIDGIRFERAERLLKVSSPTIADISHEVGYSDPAHFTRAFLRWTGETPRAYRGRRTSKV